ncbi:type IV pilin PilA [Geminocystis sp. NIES-3708]|uniref:type IV pilin protein n=1 Tax=Geminocystis sp. NIES-3708 TaxID=1615909 RepID=UPI0005FC6874|nr:type IV pilin-like G/H family protein [Geminocystis sp. NIES-3708]BAQ61045.1 type IV pilin PilA [Geminocystis sp. NIES-3708]
MKPEVTLKYLSYLRNKKNQQEGFTLIELLVVVIIIGVLAAVALPNLLGQVGKARESEAKNAMGTLNRTQQAYHFEKQSFATVDSATLAQADNVLGTVINSQYFNISTSTGDSDAAAKAATVDGVRQYAASIAFGTGAYSSAVCQSDNIGGAAAATGGACTSGTTLK